jgi:hypothetical protein
MLLDVSVVPHISVRFVVFVTQDNKRAIERMNVHFSVNTQANEHCSVTR